MQNTNQPGDFNDLVFENRNKTYGAYVLRRDYTKHVLTAFLFTCLAFVLLAGGMRFFSGASSLVTIEKNDEVDSVYVVEFPKDIPELIPEKKETSSSKPKMDNNNLVAKDTTEQKVPTDIDLRNVVIGNPDKDTTGKGLVVNNFPKRDTTGDTKPDTAIDRFPPVPPVFPGDLMTWLKGNTKYPELARSEGIEGAVYVTFIVEKDGSIGGVMPLNKAPKILEKEALRVISSMPKWSPGMKNGKPVRCYYQVPIKFKLNH